MTSFLTWMRAVGLFYRSVAPFMLGCSGLIIGFALVPLLLEGKAGPLPALVLAKLLTLPAVWYLAEQTRPHQYWFYYNLGVSRWRLWTGTALLDGVFFVVLATATQAVLR